MDGELTVCGCPTCERKARERLEAAHIEQVSELNLQFARIVSDFTPDELKAINDETADLQWKVSVQETMDKQRREVRRRLNYGPFDWEDDWDD